MLWLLPVAFEAHCMGFGVPAWSPLLKNLEEVFAIWACLLFGLVCLRWVTEVGSFGGSCWCLNDETADRVGERRT